MSRLRSLCWWQVADLVANVTVHFSQELSPLDDMLTPEEAAKDFIDAANELANEAAAARAAGTTPVKTSALPGELRSPEGALAAAREVYARALVANLEIRRRARAHFTEAARLCLEATPKGKQEIVHDARFSIPGHLRARRRWLAARSLLLVRPLPCLL